MKGKKFYKISTCWIDGDMSMKWFSANLASFLKTFFFSTDVPANKLEIAPRDTFQLVQYLRVRPEHRHKRIDCSLVWPACLVLVE
jgi:hypothetical protein